MNGPAAFHTSIGTALTSGDGSVELFWVTDLELTATPLPTVTASTTPHPLSVQVADGAGDPYPDPSGFVTWSSDRSSDVFSSEGVAMIEMGSHVITVAWTGDAATSSTFTTTVNPSTPVGVPIVDLPTTATSGETVAFGVAAEDSFGNVWGDVSQGATYTSSVSTDVFADIEYPQVRVEGVGPHVITASYPGLRSGSATITVTASDIEAPRPQPAAAVRVVDVNGSPIVGAVVTIEGVESTTELYGVTGADGLLDLSTIAGFTSEDNPYLLWIDANGYSGYWDLEPDEGSTVPIVITQNGGTITAHVPFSNDPPDATSAGIAGTVTDALTGAPLSGVMVTATDDGTGGENQGASQTGQDGTYYLQFSGGTLPSTAAVEFQSVIVSAEAPFGYEGQFYDGIHASQPGGEKPVPAKANETTEGIDAALRPNGLISGVITDGAAPLQNAQINVWDPISRTVVAASFTREDGTYGVRVGPGAYVVQAQKIVDGDVVATLYFGESTTYDGATPVDVMTKVETPSIDVSFAPPPTARSVPSVSEARSQTLLASTGGVLATALPFLLLGAAALLAGGFLVTRRRAR